MRDLYTSLNTKISWALATAICCCAYHLAVAAAELPLVPIDLSFLNASEVPAGKHGFLRAAGDKLTFDDGTVARFWGINLTAYAVFGTSRQDAEREAKRLSQLGFNMVRLHHLDSVWVVPNIFGAGGNSTSQLDPGTVEKLDWWIKCLREQGIYIWLDLHVGREFKAADGIDGFDEIARGKDSTPINGYNYVNDSVRRAMERFDEQLLNHENRFTGLRYKNDPAIAMLLLTNENDITHHYGNALLPDKHVPRHTSLYLAQAHAFADRFQLSRERVWRSWEDGPSKLFLNDLEHRFDVDVIAYLRGVGAKVPVVTTSIWGLSPLSSLPALTAGDVIDVHSYGGEGELSVNPLEKANFVDWLAAAHVVGKPLTVSEWGADRGGQMANDRQVLPLYVASMASLQAWQAVLFYAYSQEPLGGPGKASVYQAYNDPALLASLPSAALLYRQGHVAEATTTYVFAAGEQHLFAKSISPGNSVALRTAVERGKLLIAMPRVTQLPWLNETPVPLGAIILENPAKSEIPATADQITSTTGELTRNWRKGVFTLSTPQTQAMMGRLCCAEISLPQVRANLTGARTVLAVQSLDHTPISSSRLIMISVNSGARVIDEPRAPYEVEPTAGTIRVTGSPGMQLFEWSETESRLKPRAIPYVDGQYLITFDKALTRPWVFLRAPTSVM